MNATLIPTTTNAEREEHYRSVLKRMQEQKVQEMLERLTRDASLRADLIPYVRKAYLLAVNMNDQDIARSFSPLLKALRLFASSRKDVHNDC